MLTGSEGGEREMLPLGPGLSVQQKPLKIQMQTLFP